MSGPEWPSTPTHPRREEEGSLKEKENSESEGTEESILEDLVNHNREKEPIKEGTTGGIARSEDYRAEDETRWWLQVEVGEYRMRALYDPGASCTVMGPMGLRLATSMGRSLSKSEKGSVRLADGRCCPLVGHVLLPFQVAGQTKDIRVAILPGLDEECYVGVNFIRAFHAVLDPDSDQLYLKESEQYVQLEVAAVAGGISALAAVGLAEVSEKQLEQVYKLVDDILNESPGRLGRTSLIEHDIDVKSARPVKQKYYPVSPKVEQEMHRQVREMLAQDVIEPSASPWSSPIVMVKKENGKMRLCIDFRKVNELADKDAYPQPYMDHILRKIRTAKYITTLDLSSAYHQIPLSERAKPITAFTVPGMGLFQWKRMPFGLSNAGATFQRFIDGIIGPELEPFAFAYLDDIIIASETFEDHLRHIELVLKRLKEAGVTVNREKSVFCRSEVKYLGVLVNREGVKPDPAKIKPIKEYPVPKNLKQLRRFMGMASWYRKFIKDFAQMAEPLVRLTKKEIKYVWGEEQQAAFEELKCQLMTAPILHRPDLNGQFSVHTDASDTGIGAVLVQEVDGVERVLEFASRSLSPAERNYTVTERECLAVVWAIKKFRPYIEGYPLRVVTDHSSLKWLQTMKNPTNRLARWALELQGHDLVIVHRKGKEHEVPDALSRMFEEEEPAIGSVSWSESTTDEWYRDQYTRVAEDPQSHPRWKILGGNLYYYRPREEVEGIIDDEDAWKLVVPAESRSAILRECHDEPVAGHLGREKTFDRVERYYYWPRFYEEVRNYVRKCSICQQCKVEQRLPAGLLGKRVVEKPWQVVAADITGPLPKTAKGYEYVLIFQDLFTRWVEVIPIRKANAKTIEKEFNDRIVLRFGTPEVFLSDNGTEFKNKVIDEYLKERNIYHTHTPVYHPQANPVERMNRTIKTMIASYIRECHNKWDEKIPEFMFSVNSARNSSTKVSPAMLNYGRQPVPPGTQRRQQECATADQIAEEPYRRWGERMEDVIDLRGWAAKNADIEQNRQARYYNRHHRDPDFKVGDLVWRKNRVLSSAAQGVSAKLAPKYSGPYLIISCHGSNTYDLLNGDGVTDWNIHAKDIKRYFGEDEPEVDEDEEEAQPPGEEGAESDPPLASEEVLREEPRVVAQPAKASEELAAPPKGNSEEAPKPKRGPGRPRRTVLATKGRALRSGPKAKAKSTPDGGATVAKRGRGRPRKNQSPNSAPKERNDPPTFSPRVTRAKGKQ